MSLKKNSTDEIFGKAIGQLVHDIRNSLNTIIGFSSVLKIEDNLSDENIKLINKIYESGRDIEDQLLNIDYFSLRQDDIPTEIVNIDIHSFFDTMVNSRKEFLKERNISINLINIDKPILINTNKIIFEMIFFNFINFSISSLKNLKNKMIEIFIKQIQNEIIILYSDSSSPLFIEGNYFTLEEIMKSGRGLSPIYLEKYASLVHSTLEYLIATKWQKYLGDHSIKLSGTQGFKLTMPLNI